MLLVSVYVYFVCKDKESHQCSMNNTFDVISNVPISKSRIFTGKHILYLANKG